MQKYRLENFSHGKIAQQKKASSKHRINLKSAKEKIQSLFFHWDIELFSMPHKLLLWMPVQH